MTQHFLFLCSENKLRSPTAEVIFSEKEGFAVDSAGLSPNAEIRVTPEHLEWADLILVMEKKHKQQLSKQYQRFLKDKRIVVLNIPDDYNYMEPTLIELLQSRCERYFQ